MSAFFTGVSRTDNAIAAPDSKTLAIHHFSGMITHTFADADHMNQVAAAILEATGPPTPPPANRPDVVEAVADTEEGTDAGSADEPDESGSETETESEYEPPTPCHLAAMQEKKWEHSS